MNLDRVKNEVEANVSKNKEWEMQLQKMLIENDKLQTLRENDQKSILDLNDRMKAQKQKNMDDVQDI